MVQQISDSVLNKPLQGVNLPETTLGEFLADQRPTLLVFLRHFG